MPHIRQSLNTQPLGGKDNMGGAVSVGALTAAWPLFL